MEHVRNTQGSEGRLFGKISDSLEMYSWKSPAE